VGLQNPANHSPPSPISQPPGNPYRHRRSSVLEALPGGVSSVRSPNNTNDAREVQNARALQVLARVKEKLTGRDFTPTTTTGASAKNLTPGQRLEASAGAVELGAIVAAAALDGSASGYLGLERRGEGELLVAEQVEKLIKQATNTENLCQHYIGWCSFW
jgi:serine/threonine-protein kinase mTOR